MRTRSRSSYRVISSPYKRYTIKGSSPCNSVNYADTSWTRDVSSLETMSDTKGNRKGENPCDHLTVTDNTPMPVFALVQTTSNGFKQYVEGISNSVFVTSRNYGVTAISLPTNTADIFAMYQSLLPSIKQEMDESAINFIVDAPRLGSMAGKTGSIRVLYQALKKYKKDILLLPHYLKEKRSIRSFVKWLANTDLEVNFGVLPLIKDLQTFYNGFAASKKAFYALRDNSRKWRTKHSWWNGSATTLEWQDSPLLQFYVYCSPAPQVNETGYHYAKLEVLSDVSCVKLRYKYTLPDMPDWLARAMSYADLIGLNFNPKIVWDATRLSFVCDWFLKVGRFLDQFKTNLYSPSVEVYGCVHSRHLVYRRTSEKRYSSGGKVVTRDTTYDSYVRVKGIPPITSLQGSMAVDWFKVHIAASLLAQKFVR